MTNYDIRMILGNVARMLVLLDTEELEQYLELNERSLSRVSTIGAMIDPTAYRRSLQSGEKEDADMQLQIAKHLLEARKSIDKREQFINTLANNKSE